MFQLITQPLIGEPNQSFKSCWSCVESTPYNQGFCDECWRQLPLEVRELYCNQFNFPKIYSSRIRMAIADGLKAQLRPPPVVNTGWASHHSKVKRPRVRINLTDLEL